MKTTKDGKALYLHCLPADINDVSCEHGEVEASVFDRYRVPLYKEASFKPYIIAAMIFLSKCKDPQAMLKKLYERNEARQLKTETNFTFGIHVNHTDGGAEKPRHSLSSWKTPKKLRKRKKRKQHKRRRLIWERESSLRLAAMRSATR